VFDMRSSNFLVISGDQQSNFAAKLFYVPINFIVNILGRLSKLKFKIIYPKFSIEQIESAIEVNPSASPGRVLSNIFWESLNFKLILDLLDEPVKIIDLGCGSGSLSSLTSKFPKPTHYIGIDSQNRFMQGQNIEINFVQTNALNIGNYLPANLIISQSALEHFKLDLPIFKDLFQFSEVYKKPIIQIHIIPSFTCLRLYLNHGYRQYTPRVLNRILRGLPKNSSAQIVMLGGKNCNSFHFWKITLPTFIKIFRKIKLANKTTIQESILKDLKYKKSVTFYALIIYHNIIKNELRIIN
jgi:hypothetical protein